MKTRVFVSFFFPLPRQRKKYICQNFRVIIKHEYKIDYCIGPVVLLKVVIRLDIAIYGIF